jgi:hypothetical protein
MNIIILNSVALSGSDSILLVLLHSLVNCNSRGSVDL